MALTRMHCWVACAAKLASRMWFPLHACQTSWLAVQAHTSQTVGHREATCH